MKYYTCPSVSHLSSLALVFGNAVNISQNNEQENPNNLVRAGLGSAPFSIHFFFLSIDNVHIGE
jgi:hypothetical protein